jgi:hypothetical protein
MCGDRITQITIEGDGESSVVVRECNCGHTARLLFDHEIRIRVCPVCGGPLLLSGTGFAGPESYNVAFWCRSCKVNTRVSKRRKARGDSPPEPDTIALNGKLQQCV